VYNGAKKGLIMGKKINQKHYKAFISYSHDDEEFGFWLHKELEKYKIPKKLREDYPNLPKTLYPIFRDRYELNAGDDLGVEIPKALKKSDALIVVCSSNSANSKWVNKEIIEFKQLHGEDRIFPIIINGEPFAKESDKFDDSLECFPEALKYKIDSNGDLTNKKTSILASSTIEKEDGRELAKLKLIAGVLSVPFGEFYRRDEEQKRRDRNKAIGVWSFVFILMAGLAVFSWIQRDKAEKELIQSNYNLGLFLLEKAEKKIKEKDIATAHLYTYLALKKLDKNIDIKNNIAKARSIIASNPFYVPCAVSLRKHKNEILDIDISSDNKILVSSSNGDGLVRFWNMETQKELFNINDRNNTHIQSIKFSPDNKLLALASGDNISLWDIKKRKKIYTLKGHTSTVNSIQFSPNGDFLASGSLDSSIRIWDIKNKKEISKLVNDRFSISSVKFIDNNTLVSTSSVNIELWDLKKMKLIKSISTTMDGFESIDISKDKKFLALGGRILKVKDLKSNKIIFQSKRDIRAMINSVKFSPNGKILASCSSRGNIELWNIKLRKKIAVLNGHTKSVNDVEFSKDGLTLISASDDKSIRFWDISNIEDSNFKFHGKTDGTNDMQFSKSGKQFASTSYGNNVIYLWDLDTLNKKFEFIGHKNKVKKILFYNNIIPQEKQTI